MLVRGETFNKIRLLGVGFTNKINIVNEQYLFYLWNLPSNIILILFYKNLLI